VAAVPDVGRAARGQRALIDHRRHQRALDQRLDLGEVAGDEPPALVIGAEAVGVRAQPLGRVVAGVDRERQEARLRQVARQLRQLRGEDRADRVAAGEHEVDHGGAPAQPSLGELGARLIAERERRHRAVVVERLRPGAAGGERQDEEPAHARTLAGVADER
jgi:hypothetical protein